MNNKLLLINNNAIPVYSSVGDITNNAVVLYGVRKLKSDYTGNCIRVSRASDNSEQDIGFTNNELDTESLLGFCGSNQVPHSENFSVWSNGNEAGVVTSDQLTNPLNGAMTADFIDLTSLSLANQEIFLDMGTGPFNLNNRTFTGSIWIKGTAGQTINLALDGSSLVGNYNSHTLNGDWQRLSITHTFGNVSNSARFRFGTKNFNGIPTGTALQFYAWGAQLTETSNVVPYTVSFANRINSNNGRLVTWYDQSGNGRNAVIDTLSACPLIVYSGTLYPQGGNNKPSIYFQSTGNFLKIPIVHNSITLNFQEIYAVARTNDTNSRNAIIHNYRANGDVTAASRGLVWYDGRLANNASFGGYAMDTTECNDLLLNQYTANQFQNQLIRVNGWLNTPQNYTGTWVFIGIANLSFTPLNGYISEIIISSGLLQNKNDIDTNIKNYYGIS